MADGTLFEERGIPAASITTDVFTRSGDAMARRYGYPGYHYAMTEHPVSNLTLEECKERAEELLPEILEILGIPAASAESAVAGGGA